MQTISAHEHTHTHITNGSERTQQCAWSTAAASKTSKKRNYSITKHFLEWAYIRQRLNICMCMYVYVQEEFLYIQQVHVRGPARQTNVFISVASNKPATSPFSSLSPSFAIQR